MTVGTLRLCLHDDLVEQLYHRLRHVLLLSSLHLLPQRGKAVGMYRYI